MSPSRHLDEYIASYFAFGPRAASLTEETVLVRELEQTLEEKINQLPSKMRKVYELSWNDAKQH